MYSQVQGNFVDPPDDEHDDPASAGGDTEARAQDGPAALAADIARRGDGGTAEALPAEDTAQPAVPRPTAVMSFLAEIARAMQVAADQARDRIIVSIGENEVAQIEKIHLRATAESDELKKHADEDMSLVDAWRVDQIQRIRDYADRQITDRRRRLDESLTHHGALIETEVQSVQLAVQEYRASLDAFFGRLSEEMEPSTIARLAGTLPDPPDLQEVRADARSGAMKEIEQRSAAESSDRPTEGPASGEDSSELGKQLVGVMEPGVMDHSGGFRQTDASVPAVRLAGSPVWIGPPTETDSTASTHDDPPSEENVAVRLTEP
jgi:predicted nucleic acid-binding protein